jgi:hypothetical protein
MRTRHSPPIGCISHRASAIRPADRPVIEWLKQQNEALPDPLPSGNSMPIPAPTNVRLQH